MSIEWTYGRGWTWADPPTEFRLDVDKIIRDVYAMEEETLRTVVVQRLRELGYTVIEPGEE